MFTLTIFGSPKFGGNCGRARVVMSGRVGDTIMAESAMFFSRPKVSIPSLNIRLLPSPPWCPPPTTNAGKCTVLEKEEEGDMS